MKKIGINSFKETEILFGGSTDRQSFIDNYINKIKETFKLSPSYFQVTKNNDLATKYDCWITEVKDQASTNGIDKKNIILYPDLILNRGDYINWTEMGETFLVTEKNVSPYYDNGIMERCNNRLIFKNNKGVVVEYLGVFSVIGRMYLDIIADKQVVLPKDTYLVSVQSNEDTLEIIESMRFIISGDAYKVMAKSKIILQGIIQFKLQSDLLRQDDDLVNGIASQTVQQNTVPTNLAISGTTSPRTGSTNNVYNIINNTTYTYTFSLIDAITNIALSSTIAEITSQTDTSCTIKINTTSGGKQFFVKAIAKEDINVTAQLLVTTSSGF